MIKDGKLFHQLLLPFNFDPHAGIHRNAAGAIQATDSKKNLERHPVGASGVMTWLFGGK